MVEISNEDFGILCVCALRYCHGRRTYMPSLVQGIVREHFRDLSDKDIKVLEQDRADQERWGLYGDPCDKADWQKFWEAFDEFMKGKLWKESMEDMAKFIEE